MTDGDDYDFVGDCEYYNESGGGISTLGHDDVFLPYWQEYSDAIALHKEGLRIALHPQNVQLNQSVIDILGPSLKMKLNGLFLNMFEGKQWLKFAIEAVRNNPLIEDFAWKENHTEAECEKETKELISLLSSRPNLTTVFLSGWMGQK